MTTVKRDYDNSDYGNRGYDTIITSTILIVGTVILIIDIMGIATVTMVIMGIVIMALLIVGMVVMTLVIMKIVNMVITMNSV